MFSGIIEDKAIVRRIVRNPNGVRIAVESQKVSHGTKIGDSISVNGACLTVVDIADKALQFDIISQTLRATTLKDTAAGDIVNVERSLKVGDRISGHFVTGHIDCVGTINSIKKEPNDYIMEIEIPAGDEARQGRPAGYAAYLANKGSVAVDGISLTIAGSKGGCFLISLIPLTLKMTSLGLKKRGDKVNIEFDILAKYALRNPQDPLGNIDSEFLKKHGFI